VTSGGSTPDVPASTLGNPDHEMADDR
jgi:hypothetical protein